jgi:hypothetical protein
MINDTSEDVGHDERMLDEAPRASGAVRLGRSSVGERLGGFIYGTIIALAVVVAGARAYPQEAGNIAALVAVTSVVLWLAHVYAHALAHSVATNQHLSLASLVYIARREDSIVEAALPPVAALLLGAFGVVSTQVAVWAAIGSVCSCSPCRESPSRESSGWAGLEHSWSWPRTSVSVSSSSASSCS